MKGVAMPMFARQVDMRSRQAMAEFLTNHFRYSSDNSWTRSTYAHCVKIHRLGLTAEQSHKAYDLVSADDSIWDELDRLIDDFTAEMNGCFTIGRGGRSCGYLLLMPSRYEATGHRSYCRSCGQRNFKSVAETAGNVCGRCGARDEKGRIDFKKAPIVLRHLFKGIDAGEEFLPEDWSMTALRERVELVRHFNASCDDIRDEFIGMLDDFKVEEQTIMVPTKRRVLVNLHASD
jgi:hypothetical protein